MSKFPIHSLTSAPSAARPLLQQTQQRYGFVPNLLSGMAGAPALLAAYIAVSDAYASSSLSPLEQQLISITVSLSHDCNYCVAAHSTVAGMQGLDGTVLEALRQGRGLADPKLEALRKFTLQMVEQRGWPHAGQLEALLAAGYSQQTALEVVLGIAMKVLANYSDHLITTPLDAVFQPAATITP
ncbi:MAG: carboxymuconolactone decarboxylase family protein [Burkholderiaceae bacterium]|nr:carboxymuconolactone decarboxylase family protein [Burkholderiaceae bacterium]